MTYAIIDGKKCYPDLGSNSIKLTFENQFVKDSGSYSLDIHFPMVGSAPAILHNKDAFCNTQRLDVSKRVKPFEDCKVFVDNRLVIAGIGTLITVTDREVVLQIVGGKSKIKYNSKFEKHYIDNIVFPVPDMGQKFCKSRKSAFNTSDFRFTGWYLDNISLFESGIVGREGEFGFWPVYDETNETIQNRICVYRHKDEYCYARMHNLAIQPNLLYVLKYIMAFEGYTVKRCDYDIEPWNRLYIASAKKTFQMGRALPHWSVYTLIEQVAKLLNASFIFDEADRSVEILRANELLTNKVRSFEVVDEYQCDFDKDGLSLTTTGNVEYNFGESAFRADYEAVPANVLKDFKSVSCTSVEDMNKKAGNMDMRSRLTSIFRLNGPRYYIFIKEGTDENKYALREIGYFSPLIRDDSSEDTQKLRISPAAVNWRKNEEIGAPDQGIKARSDVWILSIPNEGDTLLPEVTEDDTIDYVTVQEAIEGSEYKQKEETDDSVMNVFFSSQYIYDYRAERAFPYTERHNIAHKAHTGEPDTIETDGDYLRGSYRWPIAFTDPHQPPRWLADRETASLSLGRGTGVLSIGQLMERTKVDTKNQFTIKFACDGLPSPTDLYIFHNRKFICSKIEAEIKRGVVDRLKTGYFYELL